MIINLEWLLLDTTWLIYILTYDRYLLNISIYKSKVDMFGFESMQADFTVFKLEIIAGIFGSEDEH